MRIFIAFAIATVMLLLFYPSTNAAPFFDKKFEEKWDNREIKLDIKQQMEGNGQQHVDVHKRSIIMPVADKMIEEDNSRKAAVDITDKVGDDQIKNSTRTKRHANQSYCSHSEVSISNRIIKVTQQQIGDGQQILIIKKAKRGTTKKI